MAAISSNPGIFWKEIERSESYLVSGVYDDATLIASSILKDLWSNNRKLVEDGEEGETQLKDMLESAGMVLVQALKELGRTQHILDELLQLFGSVTAIPIQVFVAGVCFQISQGTCSQDTQGLVEEFLSKWKFIDEQQCYLLEGTESKTCFGRGSGGNFGIIGVNDYLEVVEMYVVALLAMRDVGSAVSWVEKASLPEAKRQYLLRKLQSLHTPKGPRSSDDALLSSSTNGFHTSSCHLEQQQKKAEASEEALKALHPHSGENDLKQSQIIKLSQQRVPSPVWWFRIITLKLGNTQISISNGKVVLGCMVVLSYYILRRKRASLKESLKRQARWVRKAVAEFLGLAFSYQVNPLAAVQPIPTAATRRSR